MFLKIDVGPTVSVKEHVNNQYELLYSNKINYLKDYVKLAHTKLLQIFVRKNRYVRYCVNYIK